MSVVGKVTPLWLATVALGGLFFLLGYSVLCLCMTRSGQPLHSSGGVPDIRSMLVVGASLLLVGLLIGAIWGRVGWKGLLTSLALSTVVAALMAGGHFLSQMAYAKSDQADYLALATQIREESTGGELKLPPDRNLVLYSSRDEQNGTEIVYIWRAEGMMVRICGCNPLDWCGVVVRFDSQGSVARVWADL